MRLLPSNSIFSLSKFLEKHLNPFWRRTKNNKQPYLSCLCILTSATLPIVKKLSAKSSSTQTPPTSQAARPQTKSERKRGSLFVGKAPRKNAAKPVHEIPDNPGKYRIRYQIPGVARHVARAIVIHNMDYDAAIRAILEGHEEGINIPLLVKNIEKDPQVQQFIQEELKIRGLDEDSKDFYVRTLWEWFRYGTENKAMKAAGILGRAFIADKGPENRPEALPIPGIASAVESMLGNSNETDDVSVHETVAPSREPRGSGDKPKNPANAEK